MVELIMLHLKVQKLLINYVSDRMSYIILRSNWCNIIVLNGIPQVKIRVMTFPRCDTIIFGVN
jgi:hypothetical protein